MKSTRRKNKYTRSIGLVWVVLALAGCSRLSADTVEPEVVYGELMCTCGGCNQTLAECNHINCPNAVPMRAEVDRFIEEGLDQETILARFAEKYGLNVLAAPPTAGWFNIAAWLMPFVALTVGFGLVAYYARRFRGRWVQPVSPMADAESAEVQKRLEDELAEFVPED
jgi:cytochrome c-type biogenesis protein CcmH